MALTIGNEGNQPISSRIRVWLDANGSGINAAETFVIGSTNVVTATIGTHEFKAAYIYDDPTLDISIIADTSVSNPAPAAMQETTDKPARFTNGTQGKNAGTIMATVKDGVGTVDRP